MKLNKQQTKELVEYLREYGDNKLVKSGRLNDESTVIYSETDDSYYLGNQSIETKIDSLDWTH